MTSAWVNQAVTIIVRRGKAIEIHGSRLAD